jgi:hypothetical protein
MESPGQHNDHGGGKNTFGGNGMNHSKPSIHGYLRAAVFGCAMWLCREFVAPTWAAEPNPDPLSEELSFGDPTLPENRLPMAAPDSADEDLASLFLGPENEPAPEETIPDPILARKDEREEFFIRYSVDNPLTRSALHGAQGNAERFFDGFGGIPRPADSALIPQVHPSEFEFRVGPVKLHPFISAAFTYAEHSGSGQNSSPDGAGAHVAAGVSVEVGEPETGHFLTLDYGASASIDSERDPEIDQSMSLLAAYEFVKLKLGLGVAFDSLSGHSRDFGRSVNRDLLTVSFTTTWLWTEKTSMNWDFVAPVTSYSDGAGSQGLTSNTFLNFAYSPKTTVGLGFSAGYLSVEDAESQTFEQVLLRFTSATSPLITYTATGGVEFRDAGGSEINPVFSLGARWNPREGTSLSIAAEQRIQNSAAVVNANFRTSSVAVMGSQHLGSRFTLNAAVGYELASYESADASSEINREDRTWFGQLGVSTKIFKHVGLAATATYHDTESNLFPQRTTQFALTCSYFF